MGGYGNGILGGLPSPADAAEDEEDGDDEDEGGPAVHCGGGGLGGGGAAHAHGWWPGVQLGCCGFERNDRC